MRGAGKVCREAAGTIFRVNQGPPAPDVSSRERGSIGGGEERDEFRQGGKDLVSRELALLKTRGNGHGTREIKPGSKTLLDIFTPPSW